MRLKLISCEVFVREMCDAVARSPNQVDVEFLPKGLHDIGSERMRARIQAALDAVPAASYDAVAFGYGLCNNGLHGIVARELPFVVPRAHDCITLFCGSRERYASWFAGHPGTYYRTTGWLERGEVSDELAPLSIGRQTGLDLTFEQMVARYGEDNARYLYETLGNQTRNYTRLAFIATGLEPDDSFERRSRIEATERGLEFARLEGDLSLIRALVDGDWDERFLTVRPGERAVARYDDGIFAAEPC